MKLVTIIMFFLLIGTLLSSGCIENKKANETWGEKKISLDAINVSNNTVGDRSEQNDSVYYVMGNITNQNSYDAFNVKINVITYYSNGTVFAVNNTPYLYPNTIPAKGNSYFYARFVDPDKKIVRFEVKILDADAEYV